MHSENALPGLPGSTPDTDPARQSGPRSRLMMLLLLLCCAPAAADVLLVPTDFETIQAAIDAAAAGDTVVVEPGLYTENLTLRSGIDVRGEEAAFTLLRAEQLGQPVVHMPGIADVLFANFTLLDSNVGIRVTDSLDVIVANTIFDTLDDFAVDTDATSIVDVVNNVFWDNLTAIRRGSPETWVVNNIFARNIETVVNAAFFDLHANVSFNCFFDNDDLLQGNVDTAIGSNAQVGDPRFVDPPAGDFHLRLGSPCIDAGTGMDATDDTVADIGAYGGPFADPWPFPVPQPQIQDTSGAGGQPTRLTLTWEPNLDHRVADPANPGGYLIYYSLNTPGPPYEGTDAGGGTLPSPIDAGHVTSFELADLAPSAQQPSPPQLTGAESRNEAVILTWNAVQGATGYRIHYGVASANEQQVDVGERTSFTVAGLANGVRHLFRVSALHEPTYFLAVTVYDNTPERHESLFSDEASIRVGAAVESLPSNELAATPQRLQPSPDLPDDSRCFIATATWSPQAPQVELLRTFRDRYLRTHAAGRWAVELYYRHSPHIAELIDRHPGLRPIVRAALMPAVALAALMLETGGAGALAAAFFLLTLLAYACRVRRPRPAAPWPASCS